MKVRTFHQTSERVRYAKERRAAKLVDMRAGQSERPARFWSLMLPSYTSRRPND